MFLGYCSARCCAHILQYKGDGKTKLDWCLLVVLTDLERRGKLVMTGGFVIRMELRRWSLANMERATKKEIFGWLSHHMGRLFKTDDQTAETDTDHVFFVSFVFWGRFLDVMTFSYMYTRLYRFDESETAIVEI